MQLKTQAQIVKSSNFQVQALIEEINSKTSRYQLFIMAVIFINTITNAFVAFQAAYQYPEAKFTCLENGIWESCTEKFACSLSENLRRIDIPLHTYTWKYELYCDKSNWKDWALFSFWSIGGTLNLIMMQFVDKIGRKKALIISTFGSLLCVFITIFVNSFLLKVALMSISFGMSDNVFTLMFIYISETLTRNYRLKSNSVVMISFALGEIIMGCLTYTITTYSGIEYLILGATGISLISLFFIPESPNF